MKYFLLFLIFMSSSALAHTDQEFLAKAFGPKLTKTRFRAVISILNNRFQSYAERDGRKLEFYTDYNADWAQGFARRWETDQVHVYGGLAAVPGVSEDSFALVLCHELGHLYGGLPYSDEYNRMSVEGQADYWATAHCFRQVIDDLPKLKPSAVTLKICNEDEACARGLDAAMVMSSFFSDNRGIAHPKFNTPDTTVVSQVLKTHPEPQCRLDTYKAGLFSEVRPLCWMPKEVNHGRVPYTAINY